MRSVHAGAGFVRIGRCGLGLHLGLHFGVVFGPEFVTILLLGHPGRQQGPPSRFLFVDVFFHGF